MGFIANIERLQDLANSIQDQLDPEANRSVIGDAVAKKTEQSPQFTDHFLIELPDISVKKTGANLGDNGGANDAPTAEEINHRCFSVTIPFTNFETGKHTDGATFMYTATHTDIGGVNMVIDEFEDGATLDYLLRWQQLMKNGDGTHPSPYKYKRDIKVVRLSASKLSASVTTYKGYFPNGISEATHSYESNQILQYTVTFTGDDVEHTIIPPQALKDLIRENNKDLLAGIDEKLTSFNYEQTLGIINTLRSVY